MRRCGVVRLWLVVVKLCVVKAFEVMCHEVVYVGRFCDFVQFDDAPSVEI